LIFVAERYEGKLSPMWKLYNDQQAQLFMDWNEVVSYCLSSKCIPTVLFYELNNHQQKHSTQRFAIMNESMEIL
jgi:hypothetical protein